MNRIAVAQELVKLARELMSRNMDTKFSKDYESLIAKLRTLPWDSPPKKQQTSALNEVSGTIGGKEFSFAYHRPDTTYGPTWAFLSLTVSETPTVAKHTDLFDSTGRKLGTSGPDYGRRPVDWLQWVKQGEPGLDEGLVRQNLKEFSDAIEYAGRAGIKE